MTESASLLNWVIVFDLDDTLISENEYRRSGIAQVEKFIEKTYNKKFTGKIQKAFDEGVYDIWEWSCQALDLPNEVKNSFLWIYRLHQPNLKIHEGLDKLIEKLIFMDAKIAIISDGRSVSQRAKINAIGLSHIPLYLSEEYKSCKPSEFRFKEVELRWPKMKYAYIADNPIKDFIAPRNLSWTCLGANWITNPVHTYENLDNLIMPEYWFDNPLDIIDVLLNNEIKTSK